MVGESILTVNVLASFNEFRISPAGRIKIRGIEAPCRDIMDFMVELNTHKALDFWIMCSIVISIKYNSTCYRVENRIVSASALSGDSISAS